jgi:acyl-CoA synthetase (NDP forming)
MDRVARVARLLEPRSIAVIGASKGDGPASHLVPNLRSYGYGGDIYPVNPRHKEIGGLACYTSIEDVPAQVDVAAIIVPAQHVADTLRQCVRAGVGAAIIMAAGFGEDTAGGGQRRQAEIDEIIASTDLIVCGPNSEGYINLPLRLSLSFGGGADAEKLRSSLSWLPEEADMATAASGGIAIVAQSGGLGFSVYTHGLAMGAGFSHIISLGNETDVDVLDCAEYLITQPQVRVIGMYVEGLRHPGRLAAVARAARACGKSLVVGKAGTTEVGSEAALSHTGHLAGEAPVFDAVCRGLGILQVTDQEGLFDACWALALQAPLRGRTSPW